MLARDNDMDVIMKVQKIPYIKLFLKLGTFFSTLITLSAFSMSVNQLFQPATANSTGATMTINVDGGGSSSIKYTKIYYYETSGCPFAPDSTATISTGSFNFNSGATVKLNGTSLYNLYGGTPDNIRCVRIEICSVNDATGLCNNIGGQCSEFEETCSGGSCTSADGNTVTYSAPGAHCSG